ncbi:SDR family oxidoreductase [Bowmanella sp. Y26]|uniref:SDR family oxidoreductase n=1 Tax=Bowmanella yangjiangensis TaxID=2811230 RepID=UPI001BDCDB4C|nr:SDR family oxidoreductase [Bowmanella yangjiangensis]MBT1062201.1 SDR family oxidoreductase [Bowmanella yangjiangensis]
MQLLKDKTFIVAGASSGIGRAAALLFAQHGANLVLGARRAVMLAALKDEINRAGGAAEYVAGDISEKEVAEALDAAADDKFGGLDGAFNNAAILGDIQAAETMSIENWQRVIDINLTSAFLAARCQIPALQKRGGGSLIFTSTFVGYTAGMPGLAAYAASKAGLIGFTQVLACEQGSHNIRVNALLPGGTDTPAAQEFADTPESLDFVAGMHALKRMAKPEEIAQAALYLASDMSSFVTGSAMLVDGGVSISKI